MHPLSDIDYKLVVVQEEGWLLLSNPCISVNGYISCNDHYSDIYPYALEVGFH